MGSAWKRSGELEPLISQTDLPPDSVGFILIPCSVLRVRFANSPQASR